MILQNVSDCDPGNLFVPQVLLPPRTPEEAPQLSAEAIAVLNLPRSQAVVPRVLIHRAAILSEPDGDRMVARAAESILKSDPVRQAQLRICAPEARGLKEIAHDAAEVHGVAKGAAANSNVEKRVPSKHPLQINLRTIPFQAELLAGLAFIAIGLVVEWINGITLLKMADFLTDEPLAVRLAFVSPYILAAFASVWLLWIVLGPKGRRRAGTLYLFTVLPLSLMGLYCFATKMGHEVDPNPFNPSQGPPMNWVLFFGILSGAGIAGAGKILCAQASKSIFEVELELSAEYSFHAGRTSTWGYRRHQALSISGQLQRMIEEIDEESQAFVSLCQAELHSVRAYLNELSNIASAQSRLRVLPVPEGIRSTPKVFDATHNGRASVEVVNNLSH